MVTKKKVKKVDKVVKKVLLEKPKSKPTKKIQRYVAERNAKKLLKQGWTLVSREANKRTHASDLVLMEK